MKQNEEEILTPLGMQSEYNDKPSSRDIDCSIINKLIDEEIDQHNASNIIYIVPMARNDNHMRIALYQ